MIKVRFAPSPTGHLHIGNFRTALVNFLFARNVNGHFMLRIDDTDQERSSLEYEEAIKEDLSWMSIKWDSLEKQSSRLSNYDDALETLLDKKRAYTCFETAEGLTLEPFPIRLGVSFIGFSSLPSWGIALPFYFICPVCSRHFAFGNVFSMTSFKRFTFSFHTVRFSSFRFTCSTSYFLSKPYEF